MSKRKTLNVDQFNRMVYAILIKYSDFLQIPITEIQTKIQQFNQQLEKDEQSLQLRQNDETTIEQI